MKVERKPDFVPVIVTLETQEEVNKLYALLNYCPNDAAIDNVAWWRLLKPFSTKDYLLYFGKLTGGK